MAELKVDAVMRAISAARQQVITAEVALTAVHPLAAQIPVYGRLEKVATELSSLLLAVKNLPL